jgi:4-amino-4-deoxy-L-arabinose transferase-like glycosyltransferase
MDTDRSHGSPPEARTRWIPLALLAIVALGLGLRLYGLGERMLSHPENFAPGLDMPDWVRFPPPRLDLLSVLRGTLVDGHPPTYFALLLGWTKVFGASLLALRLPSALLGALSIWLVYRVALREGNRVAALVAAALLALNGHHLYWSQMARMYVPTACLALLSTLFLLRLSERSGRDGRDGRSSRGNQMAYLATTILALWTQLYAWPLVFAQMIATSAIAIRERRAPLALRTQLLAVMAGLPVVQLSMFQNPPSRWHEPAGEYFGLGYLFYSRAPFFGDRPELWIGASWLIAIGLGLVLLGAFAVRAPAHASSPAADPLGTTRAVRGLEWGLASSVTVALVAFAGYSQTRPGVDSLPLWALTVLPAALVLALPWIERRAAAWSTDPPRWLDRWAPELPLSLILALVPVLCILGVSLARGAFVARGTVVFLPFLVIATAQGLEALLRLRWVGAVALCLVLALHLRSVHYFQTARSSPRDYQGLAAAIDAELQPTDLVLVKNDFGHPPLIYYLRHAAAQLVHVDYDRVVAADRGVGRVWLVHFTTDEISREMLAAVEGLEQRHAVEAWGARALLFVGPTPPSLAVARAP